LDLQRLMELEKLAGLRLEPDERRRLLADLVELEKFASLMPDVSAADSADAQINQQNRDLPAPLKMDNNQLEENAPVLRDGFYETPPTRPRSGGEPR